MRESRLIDQPTFDRAFDRLVTRDPRLGPLAARAGRPMLRRRQPGLAGLIHVVIAQQVSAAAARAISARVDALWPGMPEPAALLAASMDGRLRAAGVSAPKIRALAGIAAALEAGRVDLDALAGLDADAAAASLTAMPGIGPWSAAIYLLFCLGRGDAFPAGDLALQVAAGEGLGAGARLSPAELLALAEPWRPLRGVAAHLLWAYHHACRAPGAAGGSAPL